MKNLAYLFLGFTIGVLFILYLCLDTFLQKITIKKIKKLWYILNKEN